MSEMNPEVKVEIKIQTDSSAGRSMATRKGLGKKAKHIQIRQLFLQDLVEQGRLKVDKVHTSENPADALTKLSVKMYCRSTCKRSDCEISK